MCVTIIELYNSLILTAIFAMFEQTLMVKNLWKDLKECWDHIVLIVTKMMEDVLLIMWNNPT